MKPGDVETNIGSIDFYVITIQYRTPVKNGRALPLAETQHYVFKSVSSALRGNKVRTVEDPEQGRLWKTADGAREALSRLIALGAVHPSQNANVCHYVKTTVETRTLTIVEPAEQ